MNLGIFGGTFDPPHTGHLILAAEAQFQLGLERILWVLTPDPPHKPDRRITPLASRLEMLQAALAGNPLFEISQVDIDRPPPHYAVDTVHLLHRQYPQAGLVTLMGGDSLRDLPRWVRPQEFVQACDAIGVMHRPGDEFDLCALEARLPGLAAKVHFLEAPLVQISSTRIRQNAANGGPFRYYVPEPVYEFIQQHRLYQR